MEVLVWRFFESKENFTEKVNWHSSTGILTRIARAILVRIPVEMCKLTRIAMSCLNVLLLLQNFLRVSVHAGAASLN